MSAGVDAVLGIDLGTTEIKVGLFALDGRELGLGRAGYPTQRPRDGWAEQEPVDWWDALISAAGQALAAAGRGHRVIGIGAVAQGPTALFVDESGTALRPAITWMDARAAAEETFLERELSLDPWRLSTLPRERWVLANEPRIHARTRWILTAWDWLAFRLSGVAVTSTQHGDVLFDPPLISAAGCDPLKHPQTVEWAAPVGGLLPGVAEQLGLPSGIPVVAGTNDALGSLYGARLLVPGDAADTGGSSGGFAVVSATPHAPAGVDVWPGLVPGRWILGGAMSATGKSLDWLASVTGGDPVSQLIEEAIAAPTGADGLVFLPYLAGERSPIWDAEARGAFVGLTLRHGRGHLARAVLEGAAFALRHVAEPIVAARIPVTEMRVCGGTAASRAWNQVKADVTGFPVAVPRVPETAALGAGILAALGVRAFADVPAATAAMCAVVERLQPRPEVRARYDDLFAVYRELYPATAQLIHRLAEQGGAHS